MNYEKVSVNIDDKKLAQIDLLVENNFYPNRSDFINEAIQKQLDKEEQTISKMLNNKDDFYIINDKVWFIGVSCFNKDFLLRVKELGLKINVKGFGILTFSSDCDEELIIDTIATISKRIHINASKEIVEYYKH